MSRPTAVMARRTSIALACLASLGAWQAALAQTELDDRWHGNTSLGGAFAAGNSESSTLSLKADASKANVVDKITLYGLTNYARSKVDGETSTTANRALLGGRYDYNLTETIFTFGGGDAETDKASGLRSRYAVNGGLGYKLVRSEATSWDVFTGAGYARVEYTDDRSASGGELLFGEESSHKLSESTTAKQRFVFRPGRGELGKLATFDASLATAIMGGWTLNTGLGVRYASKPAPGLKSTDTLLTVGFGYKY